ncbi:MAG TPA: hypothetical protein VM869_35825 [Enhygromyxa sp.]|jgi:hypothetical protein|nr:hypothetical protein [Enhygromyxa sp.]
MALTIQDMLDLSNDSTVLKALAQLRDDGGEGFGAILAGLIPRTIARTGLASSATQVEPEAGAIFVVTDTAGTTAYTMVTGTPGAGEVQVTYSSNGVATLVFNSAVTAYNVVKQVLPAGLADSLAAIAA